MAKKLNLKLNYKGKVLDFVRHGKDFKKNFFIGSNKYLYWQILDPKFPDKHMLIQQKADKIYMQLVPGAQLSCSVDGNAVDSNFLKQNHILTGNQLLLKPDMNGTIVLAPDWEISYEFKEPWVSVLTQEERQIVAQYAKRAEPSAVDRFNRNTMIFIALLAVIFIGVFELALKPAPTFDQTVEERLATLDKVEAFKATAKFEDQAPSSVSKGSSKKTEEAPAQEEAAQPGATTATGKPGTNVKGGASGLSSLLGNFDPNATSSGAQIQIVTTSESFVAARPGARPGGGSGPGGGSAGPGAGAASSFSAAVGPQFSGDIGSVATSGPKFAGTSVRPEGAQGVHVVGDASKIAPSGKVFGQTAQMDRVAADFRSKNIATISESQISSLSAEERADYANLRDQVIAKQAQITSAYRAAGAGFSASFDITIRIGANGSVLAAEVVPKSAIPESFVAEVKRIVESWTFRVPQAVSYKFPMRLRN